MKRAAEIVEVRTFEELEEIRELFRSYQAELPAQLRFPDAEWQMLPGAYSPPAGTLLLAKVADEAAGCVGLRPFPLEGACEIKRLYVRAGYRGENLGRRLTEHIIDAARALGYKRMRLDTHPPTMGAAVALYRRYGFVEVPTVPVVPVDGLLYMELLL